LPPCAKHRVAVHGRRDVSCTARAWRKIREGIERRPKRWRKSGGLPRLSVFYVGDHFFPRQHTSECRTGTRRFSWRSGLVLHPAFALWTMKLATAARSHRQYSFAVRIFGADGIHRRTDFMTAAFPPGFYCSFLAAKQQWAHCQRSERLAAACPASSIRSTATSRQFEVNDTEVVTVFRCEMPAGCRPIGIWPCDPRRIRECGATSRTRFSLENLMRSGPVWALKTQQVMDAILESAQKGGAT